MTSGVMLDNFTAKNATAHKVNSYYTLAISYCTFCVGKHTILGAERVWGRHVSTGNLTARGAEVTHVTPKGYVESRTTAILINHFGIDSQNSQQSTVGSILYRMFVDKILKIVQPFRKRWRR